MKEIRISSILFMVYSFIVFCLGVLLGFVVFNTNCVDADLAVEDNVQAEGNVQVEYRRDIIRDLDKGTIGCTMHCQAGVALFCNGLSPDKKSCKMHYVEGSEVNFSVDEFCGNR